jgi:two-component system, LytTR family, sensor kinase
MKKYLEIFLHSLFWVLTGYFFLKYSFIRPTLGVHLEIFSTILIAFVIYLNYFVLYPYLFKRNHRILYIIVSILSVGMITVIESSIAVPFIYKSLFLPEKLMNDYIRSVYFLTFLRDLGFVIFFIIIKFYTVAVKVNQLEKEKFTIENTYLRSRIAPHFLYNVLNSIYADSIIKNEKLPDYIFQLSKLLHYYVDESHRDKVSIVEELDFYRRYLELENKRFDYKVQVFLNIDENIPNFTIAPLLFEPILNNAFKYVQKDESGKIEISISMIHHNEIQFSCINTKWEELHNELDSTSKGLSNLKARLELLYPEKHELLINNTDITFRANLKVKLT